jgi:EAL domain-containing protein (putative c-di-GMP-specific phosphodiesterase class I)
MPAATAAAEPAPVHKPPAAPRPAAAASSEWPVRIRTALEKDGFQLIYQPIINLHGDAAEMFEVLVRMVGESDELITAGAFMPAAEASGLSKDIDRWVVRQAIVALGELHREGRTASFFVNLSPSAFADPDLIPLVIQGVRAVGVRPEHLVFEVDEADLSAHPAEAKNLIWAITKIGCRFAIDNFGRDVESLNHVRDMPIQFLKLDGALVRNLADPVTQAAVKAAVGVAKAIEKKVVAKSVEAADNLAALWNLGVDYVQGNYFQQADGESGYEFVGETTLSEVTAPSWATGGRR